MARSAVLSFGLLAVMYGLAGSLPAQTRSSAIPKFCSPHANKAATAAPYRKVIVERLEFDKPVELSTADIDQLVAEANRAEWDAAQDRWLDSFAEIQLRSAWQDRGYFKVALDPQAKSLGGDAASERFLVEVRVLNEGPQYHLGNVQFTAGTVFQDWELREALPMREGDIFNVESVRKGIAALTKLYASCGYIDFTAVPDTVIDDDPQRISLIMYLDEQKQYRIGHLDIIGADPTLDARLRSIIIPGAIFDPVGLEDFAKQNLTTLPPRFLDRMEARRNSRTGIVDISFDLSPCPNAAPQNTAVLRSGDSSH